jgi:hypothetical protein
LVHFALGLIVKDLVVDGIWEQHFMDHSKIVASNPYSIAVQFPETVSVL